MKEEISLSMLAELNDLVEMMRDDREWVGEYALSEKTKVYSKRIQSEIESIIKSHEKKLDLV